MANTQSSKPSTKRSLSARAILTAIVAVILFLLMLSSVVNLFIKYRAMRAHIRELKEEQIHLQEKKVALTTTNEFIGTPEGKEQIYRDKYRLVKPGEGIIVITQEPESKIAEQKKPALRRFWDSLLAGLGLR